MQATTTITVQSARGPQTVESPYTDSESVKRLARLTYGGPLSNSRFALDLLKASNEHRLSDKQKDWIHVLVCQQDARARRESEATPLSGLVESLRAARERMGESSIPRVRFSTESGAEYVAHLAGPRSRYCGEVILNEIVDGGRQYQGRVKANGAIVSSTPLNEELQQACLSYIADPKSFALNYGARTGNCCFCARLLTQHGSIEVGYGPVCATNYGLPHPTN